MLKDNTIIAKLYNAINRLFEECDYDLSINVEGITLSLYKNNVTSPMYVWFCGVVANGRDYLVGDLEWSGKGPGTYAELLRGDYDVFEGIAEEIHNDYFKQGGQE